MQERDILGDGKAFVDAAPKRPVAEILADFNAPPINDNALTKFVAGNFELSPAGAPSPPADPGIALRDHIRAL